MNEHEAFASQMEIIRINLNLSQEQMAKKLSLTPSTYRRIVNHETEKIDLAVALALAKLSNKLIFEFTNEKLDSKQQLLADINQLNSQAIHDVENFVKFRKHLQYDTNDNKSKKIIPLYRPLASLEDGMIFNSLEYDDLDVSHVPDFLKQQVDCAVLITSNHLHPAYHLNDILLIAQRPPKNNDIGIFVHREEQRLYFREFKMTSPRQLVPIADTGRLITVNENDYDDMNQWIKFGVVLSKLY